ncbi:TPA: hypothetical protein N0F65_001588, partial [Lagenidium giganteum]
HSDSDLLTPTQINTLFDLPCNRIHLASKTVQTTGIRRQIGQSRSYTMLFELTVKLGDIGRTSRTTIRLPTAQFELSIEASFVSSLKLNQAMRNETERVNSCMYLRPSIHAAQKDFIPLTDENFRARIALAMSNYDRRKKVTGPFVCQLFVFVARKASTGSALGTLRRATASWVTQAADSVATYVDANPDVRVAFSIPSFLHPFQQLTSMMLTTKVTRKTCSEDL